MGGSIKIGTVFGIPVRLHWTFAILPYIYLLVQQGSPLEGLVHLVVLFGSVFLHELGHCLAARRFGIGVIDITFWPLGGMARMTEIPEVPRVEGLVAIAGPAVNGALALVGVAGAGLLHAVGLGGAAYYLVIFALINVLMGALNLVPAFPLDGGRILRAWLARSTEWVTATEQAVAVGRFFAALMFLASLLLMTTPWGSCTLPLIAVFIWFAGSRELLAVRLRHGQGLFGGTGPEPAPAAWGAPPPPPPPPSPPAGTGATEPQSGARRPAVWEGKLPGHGFTERSVQELERYRGRLRHD